LPTGLPRLDADNTATKGLRRFRHSLRRSRFVQPGDHVPRRHGWLGIDECLIQISYGCERRVPFGSNPASFRRPRRENAARNSHSLEAGDPFRLSEVFGSHKPVSPTTEECDDREHRHYCTVSSLSLRPVRCVQKHAELLGGKAREVPAYRICGGHAGS